MTTKNVSFLAFAWFISTLICLIMEGGDFTFTATSTGGASILGPGSVINDLAAIQQMSVGNLVGIPSALLTFTRGLFRLLIWDYSFYTGSWVILRWFWVAVFSSAAVWGIGSTFAPVFANLLRWR